MYKLYAAFHVIQFGHGNAHAGRKTNFKALHDERNSKLYVFASYVIKKTVSAVILNYPSTLTDSVNNRGLSIVIVGPI